MTVEIDGKIYYRTSEICAKAGISRATLFRWLKMGFVEKHYKDYRGWRLYTTEDLEKLRSEASRIDIEYSFSGVENGKSKSSSRG